MPRVHFLEGRDQLDHTHFRVDLACPIVVVARLAELDALDKRVYGAANLVALRDEVANVRGRVDLHAVDRLGELPIAIRLGRPFRKQLVLGFLGLILCLNPRCQPRQAPGGQK
jgi:hypothetical protein